MKFGGIARAVAVRRSLFALGLLAPLALWMAGDGPEPPAPLTPGVAVAREIGAGEVHVFAVQLDPDRRGLLSLDQRGIDLALEARDAAGAAITIDGPLGRHGPETLLFPAPPPSGTWRVEVRAPSRGAGPGRYEIRLESLPTATERERLRVAAEEATTRGGRLAREATPAARREALQAYAEALPMWRELRSRRDEGLTRDAMASLRVLLGEWKEASAEYGLALPIWQELGDARREGLALGEQGLAAHYLGQPDRARETLERALAIRRRLGDRFEEAEALGNLGLVAHSQADYATALTLYEQAREIARAMGDTAGQAIRLNNLGGVHYAQGEPDLALREFETALALHRAAGDARREAETLNNVALVALALGNAQDALRWHSRVAEIARALGDKRIEARALNNIGSDYQILGAEPERSLAFYEQALPLRREAHDLTGEAATLNNLGSTHLALGDAARAVAFHRAALKLQTETGNRSGQAATWVTLGRALAAMGDLPAALASFDAALALRRDAHERRGEAEALHRRAEILLERGDAPAARAGLLEALELRRGGRDPIGEAETQELLARAEHRLGSPADALARVQAAIEIIESLRTRVVVPHLRAGFLGARRQAYEQRVELLMELHEREPGRGHERKAFEASEASRARTLLDLVREAGGDLRPSVPAELAEQRAALLRRLSAKVSRLIELDGRDGKEAEADALARGSALLQADLDNLETEIRGRDARYAELTRPDAPSLSGAQALLDEETLLLAYALGERASYLWVVSRAAAVSHRLPPRSDLEAAARRAYEHFSTRDAQVDPAQAEAAERLGRMLLGSAAPQLGSKRLVVLADGALNYVPFAALPEPGGTGDPLLIRHEVVMAPSADVLVALRGEGKRQGEPMTVAVLADPVFSADDPRLTGTEPGKGGAGPRGAGREDVTRDAFGRLPATQREAEAIARLLAPGRVLVAAGFDANRESVTEDRLGSYRILHFATHGVIDARNPELSGILLSRFDRHRQAREGFLGLLDIYSLRLGADLVVLSGCQTALGREIRGEGLVGLARGFMYAGVPQVAASLWRVQDRATAELMQRFYRAMLRDGERPAAALRSAQRSIRAQRRWSDPYYWAPFVLLGDWL